MNKYQLLKEFNLLCKKKHLIGETKYGKLETNLYDKNFLSEALQELADCRNYIDFVYIKIRRLQNKINERQKITSKWK